MRTKLTLLALLFSVLSFGQSFNISGAFKSSDGTPVEFASVVLKNALDSSFIKVESTNLEGKFEFNGIPKGKYFLICEYFGLAPFSSDAFELYENISLSPYIMEAASEQIDELVVTTSRALVEVKADRSIFNVEGTINSAGENGLSLLRKAPSVRLDNNNNISVLGRTGVLIYIDGKRVPLAGDDLTAYLQTLTSEQIDKIEIITNPGSKYEAQGNGGIIDIRLKKNKNQGFNGSVNGGYSYGKRAQYNAGTSGNLRTKSFNIFGNLNYSGGSFWNRMLFDNYQNGLFLDDSNISINSRDNFSVRLGTDFYIGNKSTIGFLVNLQPSSGNSVADNVSVISRQNTPTVVDSVLFAPNTNIYNRVQNAYNFNYAFTDKKFNMNFDADYATYSNTPDSYQPNFYFSDLSKTKRFSSIETRYLSPSIINITAIKLDMENKFENTSISYGAKFSQVDSDNRFKFYDKSGDKETFNTRRSNEFFYNEKVTAVYGSMVSKLSNVVNISAGLRAEHTDAVGTLEVFSDDLKENPAEFNYIQLFPNLGITYSTNPIHSYSLKYGRRINRPNYQILNPFREQLSELSFSKGNKSLRPEIVNNVEFSYTYNYMYNFSLSYSLTTDQITRLIGPDKNDPRAGFITWENLATQRLYAINASLPITISKFWNSYFNLGAAYTDNQADYGSGGKVDVQAFSYNIYQQQTFSLPKKWKAEISGWFSGPGVWGGVFLYDPSYSLDLGVQRKFLNDNLNAKLAVSDIFFQSGWSGISFFNGLRGEGSGNWDSRRVSLSLNYTFGNNNIKSRKRNTATENEIKRLGQ